MLSLCTGHCRGGRSLLKKTLFGKTAYAKLTKTKLTLGSQAGVRLPGASRATHAPSTRCPAPRSFLRGWLTRARALRRSTLHPYPCTLHPAPYTLHPTPYTLHPQPSTLDPKHSTLNPSATLGGEMLGRGVGRAAGDRRPRRLRRPFLSCKNIYTYMCIFIYTYVYVCIYIYIYIYVYIYTYVYYCKYYFNRLS